MPRCVEDKDAVLGTVMRGVVEGMILGESCVVDREGQKTFCHQR